MKVDIITDINPYVLDITKNENMVALTNKNADFIEAVVALDSNYKNDGNPKIVGSTAYWFQEMNKKPYTYDKCLKKVIERIDKVNSTHLVSLEDGINEMYKIIKDCCSNVDELKKAVCKNLSDTKYTNLLFYKLLVPIKIIKKVSKANNISFASKFISNARYYLNGGDWSFSRYDKVVSEMLSYYEKIYVDSNTKISKSKYKNDSNSRKNKSEEDTMKITYELYLKYMKTIDTILKKLKEDNEIEINKNEFDHIIWYSSKGK